jgi:predicted small secreted protein
MRKLVLALIAVIALPVLLSACGDTWRGVKKDTGVNL